MTKQNKSRSASLSIKRLRELATKYSDTVKATKEGKYNYHLGLIMFIDYVSASRATLKKK
jgi:hypothetical protein